MNENTVELIKKWEGLRLKAYPDPGSKDGKPVTIGYGTTLINGKPIALGTTITAAQADAYLRADLPAREAAVKRIVKVALNDNQLAALISFVYNVGIGAFEKSTLVKKLNAGDYKAVPAELRKWVNNDGKVMQGLINRREHEIVVWNTPVKSTEQTTGGSKSNWLADVLAAILSALGGMFKRK